MQKEKMKKTKIVCTIGPASDNKEMLKKLIKAGMNVMRCNFSHGDHEEHAAKMQKLREVNEELGTNVAIMLDTKGPEIRTGNFVGGTTEFKKGQVSVITREDIEGTSDRFTVSYKNLYQDVKPGGFILVKLTMVKLRINVVLTYQAQSLNSNSYLKKISLISHLVVNRISISSLLHS